MYRFFSASSIGDTDGSEIQKKTPPYKQCMKPLVNNGSYLPYRLVPDPDSDFWTINSMTNFAKYVFLNFLEERNFEQNHYCKPLGEVWNWRYTPENPQIWRYVSYWKLGFSNVMLVFRAVNLPPPPGSAFDMQKFQVLRIRWSKPLYPYGIPWLPGIFTYMIMVDLFMVS